MPSRNPTLLLFALSKVWQRDYQSMKRKCIFWAHKCWKPTEICDRGALGHREFEILWREVNPACGLCVQSWPVQADNKEPHSQSTPLTHFCFLVLPPANWWGPTVEFELRREIKRLQEYRAAGITNFCSKYLMHYSAHSHPSRKGRMILQHSGCVE